MVRVDQKIPAIDIADLPKGKGHPFIGRTIVVTGKLKYFTRSTIHEKIKSLGAKPGRMVSKNTDYLLCGEKPGSKLDKARSLGIRILTEEEFLLMARRL